MHANDFVEDLDKSKSVKFSGRNLQELRKETEPLAIKNKKMEEKLQQLKYHMSKEKEERRNPEGSRWTSGQSGSLNFNPQTNSNWKKKEEKLHKLSAGKVKIRVLTEEPLAVTRKSRLKGKICGQCEVKSAGVMCAECTEDYCIACFATFHLKGAMKHHKMVPLKTDLRTNVTSHAVASCLQKATNLVPGVGAKHDLIPNSIPNTRNIFTYSKTGRENIKSPEKETEMTDKHLKMHSGFCQEERQIGLVSTHLKGIFDEEESARSFQEAVRQWRGERSEGGGNSRVLHTTSAKATQAEFIPNRRIQIVKCQTREYSRPLKVEFSENSLTYMDRLMLKKHRRTPDKTSTSTLSLPSATNTKEETNSNLTAEEEDLRLYCASLFAVPVTGDETEHQITKSEPCLFIDFLDETCSDIEDCRAGEQCKKTKESDSKVESVQPMVTILPEAFCHGASSAVSHYFRGPTQQSRPAAVRTKTPKKKVLPKLQASKSTYPVKPSSPESKPQAFSSTEASGTSHKSKNTPGIPEAATCQKSEGNLRSPHLSPLFPQSDFSKPSQSQLSLDCKKSALADDQPSFSTSTSFPLRSTFTVSSFDSTESSLLPNVTPPPFSDDLVLESERPPSSPLKPKSASINCELMFPTQSKHFLCDSNRFPSNILPLSSKHVEQSLSLLSAVAYKETSPDSPSRASSAYHLTPAQEDRVFLSTTQSDISTLLNNNNDLYLKKEEEDEQLIDSGDEMSSDSLNMDPLQGNPQTQECTIGEEEEVYHVEYHLEIARPGSCDHFYLNDVSHPGVDLNPCMLKISEHPNCESLRTSRSSLWDVKQTESSTKLHGKSTPSLTQAGRISSSHTKHVSHAPSSPPSTSPYGSTFASNTASAVPPLSCAAEAILEISSLDLMGCEDPDLEIDTAENTLLGIEHEWKSMDEELWNAQLAETSCESQDQPERRHFIRVTVGKKQREEEEETAKTDRLSVLLLP